MNFETIDILYRSRITLLDHLQDSGYNTTPYRKFGPKEIMEMVKAGPVAGAPPALQMELTRTDDPSMKCLVIYTLGKIKQKLSAFTAKIVDTEEGFDPNTTEVIIITLEPIALNFGMMALTLYNKNKTRIRYFQAASIVNNPLKHVLVPKHEKVPADQEDALLKSLYAVNRSKLPLIRFHEDPIARMIGLLPGDIVKITRPSPTAGEHIGYRVCVA
jgi:DNA-directed RNA polymerase subunit H (RpoH/RPB5)